jgi:hypothetical protein
MKAKPPLPVLKFTVLFSNLKWTWQDTEFVSIEGCDDICKTDVSDCDETSGGSDTENDNDHNTKLALDLPTPKKLRWYDPLRRSKSDTCVGKVAETVAKDG